MSDYSDNILNVLNKIGIFNPEYAPYDPGSTNRMLSIDDVEDMVDVFEDEYGDAEQYIDKGNLYSAIGTSLLRFVTGQDPDPYAGKFGETLNNAWYGGYYSRLEDPVPSEEVLPIFEGYQNKFGILNKEGVNVAKDIINRELYKGVNVNALRKLKSIKEGTSPYDIWDIDLNLDNTVDIKDVVKATQL